MEIFMIALNYIISTSKLYFSFDDFIANIYHYIVQQIADISYIEERYHQKERQHYIHWVINQKKIMDPSNLSSKSFIFPSILCLGLLKLIAAHYDQYFIFIWQSKILIDVECCLVMCSVSAKTCNKRNLSTYNW